MKIALISLNQNWEDKKGNMDKCEKTIIDSVARNVEVVIFPEMTLTGFSMNISKISEEFSDSGTIDFFRKQALEHSITIIFGIVLKSSEKATNNMIVISSTGEILAEYAKIHPFTYSNEDRYYEKGSKLTQFSIGDISFGAAICYDLRFPELYQALSKKAEIIVTIANWPKKRVEHWETLLKARAIENQSVCIGVNRIGKDGNDIQYTKSSFVFNQTGEKLIPIFSESELDIFEINTNLICEYRTQFPVKNDRRTDFYKKVL
jgi:omega-amidase